MTRYLVSFDDGWMDLPDEDLKDVSMVGHEEVKVARETGVWIFGCGPVRDGASVVAVGGTTTDGPHPETKAILGGYAIVEGASREEALKWASKTAAACRWPKKYVS